MKKILLFLMVLSASQSFAQFANKDQLKNYIQDTIKDKRPNKVTAAELQKALIGAADLIPVVSADSSFSNANDVSVPTAKAVRDFVLNNAGGGADVSGKLDKTDTSTMLNPYLRTAIAASQYATITNLALKANDNSVVKLTTDQAVTGTKTFNNSFQVNTDGQMYWGNGIAYGYLSWNTGKAIVAAQSGKALSLYANGVEKMVIGTDGKLRYYSNPIMDVADSLVVPHKKYVDLVTNGVGGIISGVTDRIIPLVNNSYYSGDDVHKWKGIFSTSLYADNIIFGNTTITGFPTLNNIPNVIYSDSNNSAVVPAFAITHRSYNGSTGIGSSIVLRTSNNIYGTDFTGAEIQTSATNVSDISYNYIVKTMIGNVLAERYRISDKANFLLNEKIDTFYRKLYVNGMAGINGKLYGTKGALLSNKRLTHKIYTIGNSLTYSSGLSTYQNYLKSLLAIPWEVTNDGVAGNTTAQILNRFKGTVIDPGDAEYVIIEGGVNDVIQGLSAVPIQNNLQAMYNLAKANGIKVVALNVFPFKGNVNWTTAKQAVLDSVNNWIATTATNIDYKIDTYSKLEDPSNLDQLLPAYDDGGHLHLTVAGYDSVGAAINAGATFVYTSAKSAFDIDGKSYFITHPTFTVADSLAVPDKKYVDSVVSEELTVNLEGLYYDSTTNTLKIGITDNKVIPDANYTIDSTDHVIILPQSSTARTLTLPSASLSNMKGKTIIIQNSSTVITDWVLSGSYFLAGSLAGSEDFVNSGITNEAVTKLVSALRTSDSTWHWYKLYN